MVTKCLNPNVESFLTETIICFNVWWKKIMGLLFCSLRVQSCYGMIWYFKLLPKSDNFNEILAWLSSHFFIDKRILFILNIMWNYCFVRDIISWDTELSSFTEGEEVPYKLYLEMLESVWLCCYTIIILNLLYRFM